MVPAGKHRGPAAGPFAKFGYALLRPLIDFSCRRPFIVLVAALIVCVAGIFGAVQFLTLKADTASLFAPTDRYRIISDRVSQEFPNNGDMVVVVEYGTAQDRERFISELAARLKGKTDLYQDVFPGLDLKYFRQRLLYYLEPQDLKMLANYLRPAAEWVAHPQMPDVATGQKQNQALLDVVAQMAQQFQLTLNTRGEAPYVSMWKPKVIARAPAELRQRLQQLLGPGTMLYNAWPNSDIHVMLVRPSDNVRKALTTLRDEIKRLTPAYTDLRVGVTGMAAIAQDEISVISQDVLQALLLSAFLLLVLFRISFASRWRFWFVLGALLMALGWTAGFASLALSSINLLTLTVLPVLLALGAGFGIHILYGYERHRAHEADPNEAMHKCMRSSGMQTAAVASITALTLLSLLAVDFQAMVEFGILGAGGIGLCYLSSVTVLPAMLFLHERHGARVLYRPRWTRWLKNHEIYWLHRPGITLLLCAAFTAISGYYAQQVTFDHNLLNLQYESAESNRVEKRLLANGEQGVFSVQYMAADEADARRKAEEFAHLPSVARVESPLSLVTTEAAKKTPYIKEIRDLARQVKVPQQTGMGGLALQSALVNAKATLQKMKDPAARAILKVLQHAEDTAYDAGPGPVVDSFTLYMTNVKNDLEEALGLLRQQVAEPVTLASLPRPLRARSVGRSGKIMVSIYPKENPWDYQARQRFINQLQTVDPDLTGLPVMLHHQTDLLVDALERCAILAASTGTVLLLLYFRNPFKAFLAVFPLALGLLWTLGLMGLAGVDFNPVNFVVAPMLVSVGVAYGLYIAQRLLYSPGGGVLRHPIGAAVSLNGLMSLALFGSLLTVSHQGLRSLGFVLFVGVVCHMLSALVATPVLVRVLSRFAGARALVEDDEREWRRVQIVSPTARPSPLCNS